MIRSTSLLILLLPFLVVESALVKNNLHILRRNLIKNGVYDRHVKPDGKVDVQLGVRVLDMDLCPKKHVSSRYLENITCLPTYLIN